ncbi:MAG: sulfatase-like hydrolase/transferase [Gammaproteobacteria bacterium]|nr:sulfatase-like hydrolase/transferase [Gammaproteobacteria bacterium]MBT8110450.1 sulfatase-like hydrolase/transferase [Gammaproteobacteria bacterium]NNL45150.1 sulfatase-like hydrolase/transferase [Woeseiaceae bacterium]
MTAVRRLASGAALAALPLLTLCVFTPLLIYSGNPSEFTASFTQIALAYLPYCAVLILAVGLLAALLSADGYRRMQALTGAVACLLWLQSNILVWDYGELDGRSIEWLAGAWRGLLDAAIWAGVIIVSIIAFKRSGPLFLWAAAALFVVQLTAAAVGMAGDDPAALKHSDIEEDQAARDALPRFSTSKNVVHIVMDGLQTDLFEQLLEDRLNDGEDLRDQLQGFTLFRDNLGAFPYTQLTIPAMLSGKTYQNRVPVDEFIDATLGGDTVLNAASDAGFEVDIAAQVSLKNIYAKNRHTNAYAISNSGHVSARDYIVNDSARLIDLSLFRALPHFGKALVHRDELWVFQGMVRTASYLHMQYFSDLEFVRNLSQAMRVDREAPVYKIMHLMFAHRPTVGDENCDFDGVQATGRENVLRQANCGLQAVLAVFSRMKALGIYDNSLIILMADHGAWVRLRDFDPEKKRGAIDSMSAAMAVPLLAIKRSNDSADFRVSNAPTSIPDLPATVAADLGLPVQFPGVNVFTLSDSQSRERSHYKYFYGANRNAPGYLNKMHEVVVNGSVYDHDAWRNGRKFSPAGQVSDD